MFRASCEEEGTFLIFQKNNFLADKNDTFLRSLSGLNRFFRVNYGAVHRTLSPQKSCLEVEFLIFLKKKIWQKKFKKAIFEVFRQFFENFLIFIIALNSLKNYNC